MIAWSAVSILDSLRLPAVQNTPQHGLSVLEPSDWINAASACFAMVSAVAAVFAVRLAVRESLMSRTEKAAEGRRNTYRRVVLDPLLDSLPQFATIASQHLEEGRKQLAGLDQDLLAHTQILDDCKRIASGFSERFFQARVIVRQAMIAWNDEELSADIDQRMQDVQDSVIREIRSLATDKPPAATALASALSEGIARVLQDLVAYEPKSGHSQHKALRGA